MPGFPYLDLPWWAWLITYLLGSPALAAWLIADCKRRDRRRGPLRIGPSGRRIHAAHAKEGL